MLVGVFQWWWGVQHIETFFEPSRQSIRPMCFWTRQHRGIASYFVLAYPYFDRLVLLFSLVSPHRGYITFSVVWYLEFFPFVKYCDVFPRKKSIVILLPFTTLCSTFIIDCSRQDGGLLLKVD